MKERIALFGAGGRMGMRLARNLRHSAYPVCYVESDTAAQARLREDLGLACVEAQAAIGNADVVILAVPDTIIGRVAHMLVPQLQPGTMVMTLDVAAPFAGHLPQRDDVVYFVTHPCHPPIFGEGSDQSLAGEAFAGHGARQSVVSALVQGPEQAFDVGEAIARTLFAPILRSYRVTVEQMALLEPGLSQTVCATMLQAMREAMDEVVRRGVPQRCARDFLLGHMNMLAGVIFNEVPGTFSEACNKAIAHGRGRLLRDDWLGVLDRGEIVDSVRRIT